MEERGVKSNVHSVFRSKKKKAQNYNYPPCFAAQNKSGVAPNPTQAAVVIRKHSTP